MKIRHLTALVMAVGLAAALVGCQGEKGDQGPAGPAGPEGPGFTTHSYLGNDASTCGHCHATKVDGWETTKHSEALSALTGDNANNPYCIQCHTTGWDSPIAHGDCRITVQGPNMDGYDNYWNVAGDEAAARRAALENVQCEACHGAMGPTIYDHQPKVSFATRTVDGKSLALCTPCHDPQIEQWNESGHGTALSLVEGNDIEGFTAEWGRTSCWACHTSEGFIAANDADYANMTPPETVSLIGCATCHDPHEAHDGTAQLRNTGDVAVVYDADFPATMTGYGNGQLCVQCHHARRGVDNVQGQIDNGYAHFGPHESPQMDMYLGTGCYEIEGYDYESGRVGTDNGTTHQTLEQACVTCHMPMTDTQPSRPNHNFDANISACSGCHAGATDFDIQGYQTETQQKLDQILTLLGVTADDDLGDPTLLTADQRKAAYAYAFVTADHSLGVHNPKYTTKLLDNAIAYLQSLNAQKAN